MLTQSGQSLHAHVAHSTAVHSKKKRRTKDDHFKSDYANETKQALTKLNNKNFNPSRLSKKDCCSILWEITTEFHKDTEKDFDAKTALKNAIENYPHFRDVFALKLDSLTSDMIEQKAQIHVNSAMIKINNAYA